MSRGRGGGGRERGREPAGEVAASGHAQQRVRRLLRQDAAPAHHEHLLRVRARIRVRICIMCVCVCVCVYVYRL